MILDERTAGFRPLAPASLLATATTWSGALNTSRYDADGQRVLKIAGSETSRTYVVNELSEFSTEGGPIRWTVDYVSAGSRLLAAVRPAAGTFYPLTVAKSGAGAGRVRAATGSSTRCSTTTWNSPPTSARAGASWTSAIPMTSLAMSRGLPTRDRARARRTPTMRWAGS